VSALAEEMLWPRACAVSPAILLRDELDLRIFQRAIVVRYDDKEFIGL
jgi:hypothetical protein